MELSILGNHLQSSNKTKKNKGKTKIEAICLMSLLIGLDLFHIFHFSLGDTYI